MGKATSGAERLWDAIISKDMDIIKEVLEPGGREARDICESEVHKIFSKSIKVRDGMSCMHLAAKRGNVNALVEMFNKTEVKKINVERKSSLLGMTALHYAVYCGHATAAKVLLIKNAKINALTKESKNCFTSCSGKRI